MTTKPYQIPKDLDEYNRKFPRKSLQEVISNPEKFTPELLKVLEYTVENFDSVVEDYDYMAPLYALFLLAQFREERAFPLIIELCIISGDRIGDLLGDFVTEDLNRAIASVYNGDLDAIKKVIENEQVNEYVRSAMLYSLIALHVHGEIKRDEIIDYCKALFHKKLSRKQHLIWSTLVYLCSELHLTELYNEVKQAFEDDLIEPFFGTWKHSEKDFNRDREDVLNELHTNTRYALIEDTIAEMENWAAFTPLEPVQPPKLITQDNGQVIRVGRKIGRNEPCPCGSGKKYKKCCGKRG